MVRYIKCQDMAADRVQYVVCINVIYQSCTMIAGRTRVGRDANCTNPCFSNTAIRFCPIGSL